MKEGIITSIKGKTFKLYSDKECKICDCSSSPTKHCINSHKIGAYHDCDIRQLKQEKT